VELEWPDHCAKNPELQTIPKGDCFILANGRTVYMKTDRFEHGRVLVVGLESGCVYPIEPTKKVIQLDAIATISDRDC